MKSNFVKIVFGIIILVIILLYLVLKDFKFIPELFISTMFVLIIISIYKKFNEKTNDKRIIIRTKKLNWLLTICCFLFGMSFIIFKNDFDTKLLFGFLPEYIFRGVFFVLFGIALLPKNIMIDQDGIRINEWLTSKIRYRNLTEFILTNKTLTISSKYDTYNYEIFELTENTVDLINLRVKKYRRLESIRQYKE